jgi:hypothetical protein
MKTITLMLNEDQATRLLGALDSDLYWQHAPESYRNDGFALDPRESDDEPDLDDCEIADYIEAIDETRALETLIRTAMQEAR